MKIFKSQFKPISKKKPADHLIFPEINRAKYFLSFFPETQQSEVLIFPNTCYMPEVSSGVDHYGIAARVCGRKVIGHIGNVGAGHYLNILFDMFGYMEPKGYFFLIVGKQSPEIEQALLRFKSRENILIINEVPHDKLLFIYPYIDWGLILYKPIDLNFSYCAPNKLYEYWSYGIPVLAHQLEGLAGVLKDPVQGRLFDFENHTGIQKSIKEFLAIKPDKAMVQSYFKDNLSLDHYTNKLSSILNEL
jgi:hypothetical protein